MSTMSGARSIGFLLRLTVFRSRRQLRAAPVPPVKLPSDKIEPQPRTTTMQHRLHVVLPLMAAC